MKFDAHAHILTPDIGHYPLAPLGGTVRPGDLDDPVTAEKLLELLDANDVERAVVVQRAYLYGFDNSYVVDAAALYSDRLRAVCAIDALADGAAATVRHWVGRGAIGIRLTEPERGADASWFASPEALAVWETAAELRIPVRLHFFRWNRAFGLPAVEPLARRFADLPIVIDHLSNLSAEAGPPDYGFDAPLAALAKLGNVSLLFSTINLARLANDGLPAGPVLARLIGAFGADRIMWGSDIGQSRNAYEETVALADAAVADFPPDTRQQLLAGTGMTVYGEGQGSSAGSSVGAITD